MQRATILAFLTLLIFPIVTFALPDPCEPDRAKYCWGNAPDDPRRLYCLKSVESQISSPCRASLKNIKGTAYDFIEECTEDYQKFCREVPQGKGRILECLRSNSKKLDFECRKQVNMLPYHDQSR